jgi:hypothetical protein
MVIVVMLVVAGCSGGSTHTVTPSTSLPVRAAAECRAALEEPDSFVSALATTVGAIHGITGGPGNIHGYAYLYKGKPDGSFAAWCWRRVPDGYRSYVVGPGAPIFLDMGTDTRPAPGPLAIT